MADGLSRAERVEARKILRGEIPGKSGCVHCAGIHDVVAGLPRDRQPCPRVKAASFHLDGTLVTVEYWPAGWDSGLDIVYPQDVFDEIEDDEAQDEVTNQP